MLSIYLCIYVCMYPPPGGLLVPAVTNSLVLVGCNVTKICHIRIQTPGYIKIKNRKLRVHAAFSMVVVNFLDNLAY